MVNHIGEVMVSIFTLSVQWSTHIGEVMVMFSIVTLSVQWSTTSVMVSNGYSGIGEVMVSVFTLSVQWSTTSVMVMLP